MSGGIWFVASGGILLLAWITLSATRLQIESNDLILVVSLTLIIVGLLELRSS